MTEGPQSDRQCYASGPAQWDSCCAARGRGALKGLLVLPFILALVAVILWGAGAMASETSRTLTGVIRKFECGDNCYLTIKTSAGEKTGLCEAKACIPWFENQKMPKKFPGRKVRVTTGIGKQFDGNYDVVGHTTSFKKLDFVK